MIITTIKPDVAIEVLPSLPWCFSSFSNFNTATRQCAVWSLISYTAGVWRFSTSFRKLFFFFVVPEMSYYSLFGICQYRRFHSQIGIYDLQKLTWNRLYKLVPGTRFVAVLSVFGEQDQFPRQIIPVFLHLDLWLYIINSLIFAVRLSRY